MWGGVQDIVCERFTGNLASIAAGGQGTLTVSNISKSGYEPLIAIYGGQSTSAKLVPQMTATAVNNGSASFYIANTGTSASVANIECNIRVLFVKK